MALSRGEDVPVLLASASSGGTIAAVRHLGAMEIKVGVISSGRLCAAAWSRFASDSYRGPPENEERQFLERLIEISDASPGAVLLPTSDKTAWLYTINAPVLKERFRLYAPSTACMRRVLDKELFAGAVASAGLCVLPTWAPRTVGEIAKLASSLPYPILIKPRTHVHRIRNDKGVVARSEAELISQYERFARREQDQTIEDPQFPQPQLPILQQFVNVGSDGVLSVTGFIDRTGELFVTRCSRKVFLRSQPVGVGVCFESVPAIPELSAAVRQLCRDLDYCGIFEVEFVRFEGCWAAIDFNPRLFSQIGMDIRRGMPLPLFAYLAAAGETEALRAAVAKAERECDHTETVFCDRFTLRAIILAKTLTARLPRQDRAYWRAWIKRHGNHAVDFAADRNDQVPGLVHMLSEINLGIKALPRFLCAKPGANIAMSPAFAKEPV